MQIKVEIKELKSRAQVTLFCSPRSRDMTVRCSHRPTMSGTAGCLSQIWHNASLTASLVLSGIRRGVNVVGQDDPPRRTLYHDIFSLATFALYTRPSDISVHYTILFFLFKMGVLSPRSVDACIVSSQVPYRTPRRCDLPRPGSSEHTCTSRVHRDQQAPAHESVPC